MSAACATTLSCLFRMYVQCWAMPAGRIWCAASCFCSCGIVRGLDCFGHRQVLCLVSPTDRHSAAASRCFRETHTAARAAGVLYWYPFMYDRHAIRETLRLSDMLCNTHTKCSRSYLLLHGSLAHCVCRKTTKQRRGLPLLQQPWNQPSPCFKKRRRHRKLSK